MDLVSEINVYIIYIMIYVVISSFISINYLLSVDKSKKLIVCLFIPLTVTTFLPASLLPS